MIDHLGHFLLGFFGQIWTQGTLRHILGPILVIFEICQFLTIPGHLSTFQKMGGLDEGAIVTPLIGLVLGGKVPRLNYGPIFRPIKNTFFG